MPVQETTAAVTAANAVPLSWYLIVSTVLFTIGVIGVLVKRNPIVIFMCIELMLNSVNLSFIAFAVLDTPSLCSRSFCRSSSDSWSSRSTGAC